MILLVLAPLSTASAARPLPRVDEALVSRRYWAVEGEGPVHPRWRNRRGTHQCWTWPDGVAEHCDRYEGRAVVERRHFGAGGRPITTTRHAEGRPVAVTVHGLEPVEIDVSGWVQRDVGPLALLAPTADGEPWAVGEGELRVAITAAGQGTVFDDGFLGELRAWCACVVEDRTTAWVDAAQAVRYRVRHPHPTDPTVGEVWAVPRGDRVLVVGFVVPSGPDLTTVERRLAGGRATVALARWAQEAP